MQEKYIGDEHDYIKYALLRYLQGALDLRLGINWYLADPSVDSTKNKDGGNRGYLNKQEEWCGIDAGLFKKMAKLQGGKKSLCDIYAAKILPKGTIRFGERIGAGKGADSPRQIWHAKAMKKLQKADLIFLDPDNGLEVKSMGKKKAPKYVHYVELKDYKDYIASGKSIVSIQFRWRRKICEQIAQQHARLALAGLPRPLTVSTGRILFYVFASTAQKRSIAKALRCFASKKDGWLMCGTNR